MTKKLHLILGQNNKITLSGMEISIRYYLNVESLEVYFLEKVIWQDNFLKSASF